VTAEAPPTAPRTRVTILLAVCWALFYGLSLYLSGGPRPVPSPFLWGTPSDEVLRRLGAEVPALVRQGDWQRVITHAFLHGFLLHLVLNVWVWLAVGRLLEQVAGSARCWIVFCIAAIGGGIAHLLWVGGSIPAVGASGGIFGAVGALGIWSVRARHPAAPSVRRMVFFFLVISALLVLVPGVSHAGHGGGFVGGALAMLILGPRRVHLPAPASVRGAAVVLALLAVTAGGVQAWRAIGMGPRGEVAAFVTELRAVERLADRIDRGARYIEDEKRQELGGRIDALLGTDWLEGWEGETAFRAYMEALRPLAEGNVPDPFVFDAQRDAAKAAWRPYFERLRAEHGLR
jgi:membrane associated rhomboid family serine protease